jgi:hypothetical protein
MKKKLLSCIALLFGMCINAQSVRYATLTSNEFYFPVTACNGSNGAYFNLLFANYQLLANLNPADYVLTDYYPSDSFGPRSPIPEYLLSYYPSCATTISLSITNIYNPQIYFEGQITLQINKPVAPIYHYKQTNGGGGYFYTQTYSTLGSGSAYGLTYLGVAFKAHSYQVDRSIPVYRYFSPTITDHFYTINPLPTGTGYDAEGIEFYAYNYQYSGTVPIHRYYSPSLQNHFYSTVNYGSNGGYIYEGIEFYAFPSSYGNTVPRESSNLIAEANSKDKNWNDLTVFPNPTSGLVTIKNDSNTVDSIVVSDILGKTVQNKTINGKTVEINLSNLSSGVYYLKAKSGDLEKVVKVVKE